MAELKIWGTRNRLIGKVGKVDVEITVYNKPLFWLWWAFYKLEWGFWNRVADVRHYVCRDFD